MLTLTLGWGVTQQSNSMGEGEIGKIDFGRSVRAISLQLLMGGNDLPQNIANMVSIVS